MKRHILHRKSFRNHMRLSMVACGLTIVLAGCGTGESTPSLSPVTGIVTVEGQPLAEGLITFYPKPVQGKLGPSFGARIQSDGSFELLGPNGQEGAIPGRYQVVINSLPVSHEQLMKTQGKLTRESFLKQSLIPPQYQAAQTTPLIVEVQAEDENRFQFQLEHEATIQLSRAVP